MAAQKFKDPVDIDKWLGKARSRIYRVGVELEGGWDKLPQKGVVIVHDGSVRFPGKIVDYIGEIPSPALEVSALPRWMGIFHPQHVNETCGMHVHMSFMSALCYARLMRPEYPATIIKYVEKWARAEELPAAHPIWDRLAGKSRFCQHVFHADEQVSTVRKDHDQQRPGHRYTVMNYCFNTNGTMECRLLPMMEKAEQSIRAVQEIINITNAFLVVTAQKEKKVKVAIDEDSKPMRESSVVVV